jgi:hypothetical protein
MVWASPLSLATTRGMHSLSLFLRVHEMFQFPAFPYAHYVFTCVCRGIARGGFPHSDIPGSLPVCGSPRLFAAYHVLRRLPAPRHPPYALCSLTNCLYFPLRASSIFSQVFAWTAYTCLLLPFFSFLFTFPLCGCQRALQGRLPGNREHGSRTYELVERDLDPPACQPPARALWDELIIDLKSSARRLSALPNSP